MHTSTSCEASCSGRSSSRGQRHELNPQEQVGWLTGLQDRRVSSAIALVHQSPERRWTVEALAQAAAMSRSAFSARFTELVGEPAMKYVTRWRMHLASVHLRDGNGTIDDIAMQLEYGRSE